MSKLTGRTHSTAWNTLTGETHFSMCMPKPLNTSNNMSVVGVQDLCFTMHNTSLIPMYACYKVLCRQCEVVSCSCHHILPTSSQAPVRILVLHCRDLQGLMTDFQQLPSWSNLGSVASAHDEDPVAMYNSRSAARCMSASSLAQFVRSNRSRWFDWPTYREAFKQTFVLHKFNSAGKKDIQMPSCT